MNPLGALSRRRWLLGRWLLGAAGLLAVAGLVVLLVLLLDGPGRRKTSVPAEAEPDPFPLPPLATSPYRNTTAAARYVGSDECRSCHEDSHVAFRHTGMGRSMADVNVAHEPPDGSFDHPASKRRYQIRRKDGVLWHRELLLSEGQGTEEILLEEHPVKTVIGSGRHARTYLVDVDGFLVESPVTWYPSRNAWGMSPGYDKASHLGFMRAIGEGCLFCHAGRSETVGQSLHKMHISEQAIGCERCHGPGSLHIEKHTERHADKQSPAKQSPAKQSPAKQSPAKQSAAGKGSKRIDDTDDTIVNPARLSRELGEAVCQQCHFSSSAAVGARGRKLADFRPGLPWQDFQHVYTFEGSDRSMTVVGHVEQMHLSRCYQATKTLSCLTCHDPHGEPAAAERSAYYRAICVNCHKPERCTVDSGRRARQSPDNDCVRCHMPRSATDIPHLAFTHHRIGLHEKQNKQDKHDKVSAIEPTGPQETRLRPFLELPQLSDPDRRRGLGLAYLTVSLRETDAGQLARYRKQALELLSAARQAGLREANLDAALAQLRFDMKLGEALEDAENALAQPDLAGQGRCDALLVRARVQAEHGNYDDAIAALDELRRLRRNPFDWLLSANCRRAQGDERAAEDALNAAVRINPRLWNVHRYLAERYRSRGDARRAAWHQQRAVP